MNGRCWEGVWKVSGGYLKCLEGVNVCKYAIMQECKYASVQVCEYASMQVCTYSCFQVCMYASIKTKLWSAQKEKQKENSSVALLSPTCLGYIFSNLHDTICLFDISWT